MAWRSPRMPSLEPAACIQYQKTHGLAASGGWRNVPGSIAAAADMDCRVAAAGMDGRGATCADTANGKINSTLIHSRITNCIVMIFFKRHFVVTPADSPTIALLTHGSRLACKFQRP